MTIGLSSDVVGTPNVRQIFFLHLLTTLILFGLIVGTQLISYPLFELVSQDSFSLYYNAFFIRVMLMILFLMVIEGTTVIQLLRRIGDHRLHSLLRADLALLITTWLIVFLFELPNFIILRAGYQESAINNLFFSGWFKLMLGSLRIVTIVKMIKFFFSYDTAYDYDEFV